MKPACSQGEMHNENIKETSNYRLKCSLGNRDLQKYWSGMFTAEVNSECFILCLGSWSLMPNNKVVFKGQENTQ